VDGNLGDDPVLFRLGDFNTPSQTQALDCNASGAAGWRAKIVSGCEGWAENLRNGVCSPQPPTPGAANDCIDSENGKFSVQQAYKDRFTPDGCAANPNNWNRNGYTLPPLSDPRWAQLFVVDRHGFTSPGKKTYPVRRFINVYVTAAEGFDCPGDVTTDASTPRPAGQAARRNELWGHVTTYAPSDPGAVPSGVKCSFTDGGLCVPVLIK
jgi:hypothetical protein